MAVPARFTGPIRVLQSLLLALAVIFLVTPASAANAPRRGDATPAFALSDTAGQQLKLPESAQGKVLVLHFWGSSCGYCRDEIKILTKLHGEFKGELLPVSINVGENLLTVNKFIDKLDPSYPMLLDSDAAVSKQFGIFGIPVTYIADRAGTIRFRIFGEINEPGLRKLLAVVLPGK